MTERVPEPLVNCQCVLGENPLWDAGRNCLYWTDILEGRLYRFIPADGAWCRVYNGLPVGGFTLQQAGGLLLFRQRDIVLFSPDDRSLRTVWFGNDRTLVRFNDVCADPEGRVFAGSIGPDRERGGLYRLDRDGRLKKLFAGTGCSNGMGFSPDQRYFYWTCSTRRILYRFSYDRKTGNLFDRSVFYRCNDEEGLPDGLAVDREGGIWSARWDGGRVCRHSTQGTIIDMVRFPVPKVTSVCFGGEANRELFVTTASVNGDAVNGAGNVFRIATDVIGLPRFVSRIYD